jgi:hypothetical protein
MSWMDGTTYTPAGALASYGMNDQFRGLSPTGVGAFSAMGNGISTLGAGLMSPQQREQMARDPLAMGATGIANGLKQSRAASQPAATSPVGAFSSPGETGLPGMGLMTMLGSDPSKGMGLISMLGNNPGGAFDFSKLFGGLGG